MSAILALETGHVFHGSSIGITGIRVGELVFNTAMTGYQEILTDPSYKNQIITFTYPHIGNTGINSQDMQSKSVHASGVVIKAFSLCTSNWRASMSLQEFLIAEKVVGITNIDTRGLTKIIRAHGALRACIMSENPDKVSALKLAREDANMIGKNLTAAVTTSKQYMLQQDNQTHVLLYDFGVKQNIIDCLTSLGCRVTVVPATTSAAAALALEPDGILLSNGPGDPAACKEIIANIKILIKSRIPIFGICLGHQLLALALGAKTYKMEFGHRGANHPVQQVPDKRVLITSQNHGFAVAENSLPESVVVTHRSLFDNSLQGFAHKHAPLFGFQGHPEASPGPQEAKILFERFLEHIQEYNATTS